MTTATATATTLRPTKALCIGINYIGTANALNGCINDALDCRALLIERYGYAPENVRLLTDAAVDTAVAGNAEAAARTHAAPTRAAILEGLAWLAEGLAAGDKIAMTFSGHGYFVEDRNSDEKDGKDEVLCALDGIVKDDELFARLVMRVPAGAQLACLFDCCHSGTLADLPFNLRCVDAGGAAGARTRFELEVESGAQVPGRVFLYSGCFDAQTSLDVRVGAGRKRDAATGKWVWDAGRPCGAFTHSLFGCLQETGYRVAHRELVRRVNGVLRAKRYEQVSMLSVSQLTLLDARFEL
jgi:metacaspase-1